MMNRTIQIAFILLFLLSFPGLTQGQASHYEIQNSGTDQDLHSVHFLSDTTTGWCVGDSGTIIHTMNAGSDWNGQQSGTLQNLRCVRFPVADTGWAVGDSGTVLYTEDGGSTWNAQNSGTEADLYSGRFISSDTGWAVGDSGTVLRTFDGGVNWTAQNSGTSKKLRSVDFYGAQIGCAVGDSGVIIRTNDTGSNWIPVDTAQGTLYSLDLIEGSTHGWASGEGGILKSQDLGSSWVNHSSTASRSICFIDTTTGWYAYYSQAWDNISYTHNGGGYWNFAEATVGMSEIYSIYPVTLGSGWIVGNSGQIKLITEATRVGIEDHEDAKEDKITLRPNPFRNSVRFHFEGEERPNTIALYSLQGKKVREERLNKSESHTLRRKNLKAGIYIYEARNEEGVIGRGKLVVE